MKRWGWDAQKNPWKAESNFLYRFHIQIYNENYILRELDQAVNLMLFLKLTQMCKRNFKELFAKYAKFITLVKYYPGE